MSKPKSKSKTIRTATIIAILGVVEVNFGLLRDMLGDWHGVSYIAIAVIMAYLRTITKEPVE